MFVHDGLVHRRFPVGPIADVPYLRKVAAAHQVNYLPRSTITLIQRFLSQNRINILNNHILLYCDLLVSVLMINVSVTSHRQIQWCTIWTVSWTQGKSLDLL